MSFNKRFKRLLRKQNIVRYIQGAKAEEDKVARMGRLSSYTLELYYEGIQ